MRYIDQGNPVAKHPINEGLVAWWIALPQAAGASGWGSLYFRDLLRRYDGTLGPLVGWGGAGPTPRAGVLSCTGGFTSGDGVSHARVAVLQGAAGFTVSGWFRLATTPGANDDLWGKWDSGGVNTQQFARYSAGIQWFVMDNANVNNQNIVIPAASLTLPGWNYITCVADGSNLRGYLNGRAAGTPAALAGPYIPTDTAVWKLGGTVRSQGFAGAVNDFRYYSRALSADAVAALHSQSRRGHPDTLRWLRLRAWLAPAAAGPPPGGGGGRVIGSPIINARRVVRRGRAV
jgi:hypothetical protein